MSMSSFEDEPAGRLSWRVLLIAFAGYSVLALLMTWPLVLHLTSALPRDAGDPLLSATILWWNAYVLPLTRRWVDGFFYYPAGGALALSDHRLGLSPIASPLLWMGVGPVTTYNVVLLATYPLCAIVLSPIAVEYWRVHQELGLSRTFVEVVLYSADVTSIFTAPSLIALWGWTAPLNGNEARIFPGLTIMVLAALGIVAALRRQP